MCSQLTVRHEKLSELLEYWNRIRGAQTMPSRADFDPLDIPRLLPNIVLLDVERDPIRFRVRLYGTAIVTLHGRDLTGRYLDEPRISKMMDIIDRANRMVVQRREPHYLDAAYPLNSGKYGYFYRLGLPLSANGTDVDMILIGFYQRELNLAKIAA